MHLRAIKRLRGEAAIGGRNDVLPSNQLCKPDEPFCDPLRMFHNVAGVRNDAGSQDFAFRQLQTFEKMILVLMAGIRRFEAV